MSKTRGGESRCCDGGEDEVHTRHESRRKVEKAERWWKLVKQKTEEELEEKAEENSFALYLEFVQTNRKHVLLVWNSCNKFHAMHVNTPRATYLATCILQKKSVMQAVSLDSWSTCEAGAFLLSRLL